ncbi:MAG: anion permease, partial [Candidatus Magnetomorum sp.]|nr:anion permease [Candidatus Magnetomorum sp.]
MDNYTFPGYLWHRLPIILIFVNSYLVYRILVSTQLTHVFVQKALLKSHGDIKKILLYILVSGAVLSFFIPNAVTVLILLPILKQIDQQKNSDHTPKITTALALSAIYGANIGGMGSLVGSPANLILIGALDLLGGEQRIPITFLNWFLWSIPLVVLFLSCAYAVLRFFTIPSGIKRWECQVDEHEQLSHRQKKALRLFLSFILFWSLHSLCQHCFIFYERYQSVISIFFIVFFFISVFLSPSVLPLKQLVRGGPIRGLMVMMIFVCFMVLVRCLKLDHWGADQLNSILPDNTPPVVLVFWITSISILLTEFLSNTIVSTAMFPIVYQTGLINHINPILL